MYLVGLHIYITRWYTVPTVSCYSDRFSYFTSSPPANCQHGILVVQWYWGSKFSYCLGRKCFKIIVPLNPLTTVRCTDASNTCRSESPYIAPRPVTEELNWTSRLPDTFWVATGWNSKLLRNRQGIAWPTERMLVPQRNFCLFWVNRQNKTSLCIGH